MGGGVVDLVAMHLHLPADLPQPRHRATHPSGRARLQTRLGLNQSFLLGVLPKTGHASVQEVVPTNLILSDGSLPHRGLQIVPEVDMIGVGPRPEVGHECPFDVRMGTIFLQLGLERSVK
jgi:hypothetical protein